MHPLRFLTSGILASGCHTYTFKISPKKLAEVGERRHGALAVREFVDKRGEKTRIGELRGGFGNKVGDIVTAEDLQTSLTEIFRERLRAIGYSLNSDAAVS